MRLPQLLGSTAAAALLALLPAAAYAGTEVHADSTGDVKQVDLATDGLTPAPTRTQGDITSIRVVHGPRRVRIRMTFRELDFRGDLVGHDFRIRTPHGGRELAVFSGPGAWTGTHRFTTVGGGPVRCRGVHHRVDYVANTISAVIPRSCLGNPRWVQVGGGTFAGEDFDSDQPRMFVDDARSAGIGRYNLRLGPRVYRAAPASMTDS